jgi:hypothetical protein
VSTITIEQLPHQMQGRIAVELAPVAGLAGFCWSWTGTQNGGGYGVVYINGRTKMTHRVAWEAVYGPIPNGLQIDHLCVNKLCRMPCGRHRGSP